ncbi:MAG: hypothetical protein ABI342_03755 [Nitrososphaera sp.]
MKNVHNRPSKNTQTEMLSKPLVMTKYSKISLNDISPAINKIIAIVPKKKRKAPAITTI